MGPPSGWAHMRVLPYSPALDPDDRRFRGNPRNGRAGSPSLSFVLPYSTISYPRFLADDSNGPAFSVLHHFLGHASQKQGLG
jgi:hypothetical protein